MEGRKLLKLLLWGLGIVTVIGYSIFIFTDFIRGPRIIILAPQSGFSTATSSIIISGKGVHTNNITINGTKIPVDLNGGFSDQLILAPGYNIIKIVGKDTYNRVVEKAIETVFIPSSTATSTIRSTTTPEIITE